MRDCMIWWAKLRELTISPDAPKMSLNMCISASKIHSSFWDWNQFVVGQTTTLLGQVYISPFLISIIFYPFLWIWLNLIVGPNFRVGKSQHGFWVPFFEGRTSWRDNAALGLSSGSRDMWLFWAKKLELGNFLKTMKVMEPFDTHPKWPIFPMYSPWWLQFRRVSRELTWDLFHKMISPEVVNDVGPGLEVWWAWGGQPVRSGPS